MMSLSSEMHPSERVIAVVYTHRDGANGTAPSSCYLYSPPWTGFIFNKVDLPLGAFHLEVQWVPTILSRSILRRSRVWYNVRHEKYCQHDCVIAVAGMFGATRLP